ncbi:tRNA uridine-5-carboxymethylaminomethyl(34) synthesis GTPase MnmE [Ignavibacteria bacterium]|nr:tRNA uridine-5-carboxymethylaminomethyl(34) synthesis GTPase MnmE [Bacteroidota bacterium]MCZ2131770.1 tRNA uridine-5-carboxymethylaminomethyl(34) synthesis GTPase MnmE [Bacteroidota bacterium]
MSEFIHDVICAPATPSGLSGLAVIRVSGRDAFSIVDSCFRGKAKIASADSHTILYGKFFVGDTMIDTVTVSVFRAPNSYTGENVAEIGCHGGSVISDLIVQALITAGCRFAGPGEFTKRAFLNGKLDLTQAEAVADIIHASSRAGSLVAARQIAGGFTVRVAKLRSDLLDVCALLEAELDFAHEDIEFIDKSRMLHLLTDARNFCTETLELHHSANILRDGLYVGIAGYPNAGKSTLFNALIGKHRAIVSDIPGTTRDYIEETTHIGGIAIKYFDTAGIRESDDIIEIEGIKLAEAIMRQCNVLLIVNDVTVSPEYSLPLFNKISEMYSGSEIIYVQNKIDAADYSSLKENNDLLPEKIIAVSARSGEGIAELRKLLADIASDAAGRFNDILLNRRHASHLQNVAERLDNAIRTTEENMSNEFIALDVRAAIYELGMITGQVWSEEILNQIFERFCIGK